MMTSCVDATSNETLPVLSLVVAALAVFVGPILTWKLTDRQIKEARNAAEQKSLQDRKLANKQIVAPMRQAWINDLRDNIAKIQSSTFRNKSRGIQSLDKQDFLELTQTLAVIELSLNANEDDHKKLLKAISELAGDAVDNPGTNDSDAWREYWLKRREITNLSTAVLKREWDRVKSDDAN